ncbi:Charged multivesicular body protein 1 [Galdieria sulphuraria]|uniref:Charged multivesicular body protein 1 n=1 Tax=Galdieria sulphuraria TaxID=130081 RepID=M2VZX7_GALSU|nr:charged multivesicular body protein 1 [Galdieria sulphuraria]EME28906.1 charged multivesicular body protein 1 [Galdieria sulphuraria]GJD08295.1 Charged multivesicular body protein 1 [Galdieria sulphuraria]|eukprot:XP_005705426.1 charged multivesicular body protein 1 [Galdieria sulphuraria]
MGLAGSKLEDQILELRLAEKQLGRAAKKCQKNIQVEKRKCKEALEKGNHDGARIFAENAIRNEKQSLAYFRLQSRVDAVVSKLEAHHKMQTTTNSIRDITVSLDKALQSMNIEKISQVMDKFESQFEDIDLRAQYVDGAISQTTALATPSDQVDALLQKVADENGLELADTLDGLIPINQLSGEKQKQLQRPDDLEARFAALSSQK